MASSGPRAALPRVTSCTTARPCSAKAQPRTAAATAAIAATSPPAKTRAERHREHEGEQARHAKLARDVGPGAAQPVGDLDDASGEPEVAHEDEEADAGDGGPRGARHQHGEIVHVEAAETLALGAEEIAHQRLDAAGQARDHLVVGARLQPVQQDHQNDADDGNDEAGRQHPAEEADVVGGGDDRLRRLGALVPPRRMPARAAGVHGPAGTATAPPRRSRATCPSHQAGSAWRATKKRASSAAVSKVKCGEADDDIACPSTARKPNNPARRPVKLAEAERRDHDRQRAELGEHHRRHARLAGHEVENGGRQPGAE